MGAIGIVRVKAGNMNLVALVANAKDEGAQPQSHVSRGNPFSKDNTVGAAIGLIVDDGVDAITQRKVVGVVTGSTDQRIVTRATG